ncbi:MAG: hypothetical protein EOT05_03375 [Candidatus Microsaccharimonas sossegonensis]|uniref:Uncharacterized protein n=1 Tax=Candidatus Microsaccharimonas sossegonensis TaxID=2506948 RepID=A0A4Q0AI13_9BACT|nr:MAG: hypothetical protein EOT05_03375 [Candidatus Microsaccharimonas sossegonensis]
MYARGKVLRKFADKIGLVYFGTVDQHEDEHEVIRGLTVSTTHKDSHFAVGSFDDYDISLVDRFDVSYDVHHKVIKHSWVILQVSLQNKELPHIFFKPIGHSPAAYNRFFTAFHTLHIINDVFNENHPIEFHHRYELYGLATHVVTLEKTLNSRVTQTIAARFWPHAIEVHEGKLYVYITEPRLSEAMLAATLQASTWLAGVLDDKEE